MTSWPTEFVIRPKLPLPQPSKATYFMKFNLGGGGMVYDYFREGLLFLYVLNPLPPRPPPSFIYIELAKEEELPTVLIQTPPPCGVPLTRYICVCINICKFYPLDL